MRGVALLLVALGAAVIWSALAGRSPLDEWQSLLDTLTHQHGGAPSLTSTSTSASSSTSAPAGAAGGGQLAVS